MKINFDIDTYKTRFLGGARSYLFFCIFSFPSGLSRDKAGDKLKSQLISKGVAAAGNYGLNTQKVTDIIGNTYDATKQALSVFGLGKNDDLMSYLVKSTALPSSQFEEKVIDWQGLPYKMAGDRIYDDWVVTFNVDEKAEILTKFYDWQKCIQNPLDNQRTSAEEYMRDQEVHLVDYSGNSLKGYRLFGAWPKSVSQVSLDYSANEIAQVEVTFCYQYYYMWDAMPSAAVDLIKRGAQRAMGLEFSTLGFPR